MLVLLEDDPINIEDPLPHQKKIAIEYTIKCKLQKSNIVKLIYLAVNKVIYIKLFLIHIFMIFFTM